MCGSSPWYHEFHATRTLLSLWLIQRRVDLTVSHLAVESCHAAVQQKAVPCVRQSLAARVWARGQGLSGLQDVERPHRGGAPGDRQWVECECVRSSAAGLVWGPRRGLPPGVLGDPEGHQRGCIKVTAKWSEEKRRDAFSPCVFSFYALQLRLY